MHITLCSTIASAPGAKPCPYREARGSWQAASRKPKAALYKDDGKVSQFLLILVRHEHVRESSI